MNTTYQPAALKDGNAVAVYIGTQPAYADLPAIDLFNLTCPLGCHPKDATVGVATLERLGYSAPDKPEDAYRKMTARSEAAEALNGELRESLAHCKCQLKLNGYKAQSRLIKRIDALLAKTPADMGAELAELREDKARLIEAGESIYPMALAWLSHWKTSEAYGQGTESPTHREAVDQWTAAMQAGKEAQ